MRRSSSSLSSQTFGLTSVEKKNLAKLVIPSFENISPDDLIVEHLKGGLTNLLSTVKISSSFPSQPFKKLKANANETIALIREYGKGSDVFMNRAQEEKVVQKLSDEGISPKIFACYPWGRIEEYLPNSRTLSTLEFRTSYFERVGDLLGKFHHPSISNELIKVASVSSNGSTCLLQSRLQKYLELAKKVSFENGNNLEGDEGISPNRDKKLFALNVPQLEKEVEWLITMLNSNNNNEDAAAKQQTEEESLINKVVFSHCDLQEGNILLYEGQMHMIDFEYSDVMNRGFDFGNCFAECTMCYHISNFPGFTLNPDDFPNLQQQEAFCLAYAKAADMLSGNRDKDLKLIHALTKQARKYVLASHLHWVLWSIIMSERSTINFGYLEYALARLDQFYVGKRNYIQTGEPWDDF